MRLRDRGRSIDPWLGPELLPAALIFLLVSLVAVTRDFGWFIIGLMAVPFLLIASLAGIAWSVVHRRGARTVPLALAIIGIAWPLSLQVQAVWDWTGVALWSLEHRTDVTANAGRDAILTGWGDWGWAGGSTFAYVILDKADESGSAAGADRWRRRLRLDCPVASSRRIWAKLYLVETSDCPFDNVPI